MMSELSEPLENYLKEIYELEETKGQAKVVDLIEAFSISPGTISKALERLESLGFIDRSTKRIRLTEDGRKVAERLIRAHRLSERLLTDILEVDWIRAHELAHRLEHIWPEDVLEKMDRVLGNPATCPHGHPIPGRIQKEGIKGTTLDNVQPGEYRVVMIVKEREWILRAVEDLGLIPGKRVKVEGMEGRDVRVEVDGKGMKVPIEIAEQVVVSGIR
ncbi:Mn-dependent transcriptional regulator [Metallosphaera yellowstonensis MK1]|jgi:Mn-dependent transcriptional regulator|uniref:Mn-dependent transcriptional regulator n=2 Tax=Metallosphaera TaxID=41980 RepID=H2C955_9CREN|nr:Mn-dependent transcriptional regulator [Metallosphaera yellowstonensis MK1]